MKAAGMILAVAIGMSAAGVENELNVCPRTPQWRGTDAALERFYRENDGKTMDRLPSWVEPTPVFLTLANIELKAGGEKITRRILEHVRDKSGANVLAYSPRCRLDLSDKEFMRRVKSSVDFTLTPIFSG